MPKSYDFNIYTLHTPTGATVYFRINTLLHNTYTVLDCLRLDFNCVVINFALLTTTGWFNYASKVPKLIFCEIPLSKVLIPKSHTIFSYNFGILQIWYIIFEKVYHIRIKYRMPLFCEIYGFWLSFSKTWYNKFNHTMLFWPEEKSRKSSIIIFFLY